MEYNFENRLYFLELGFEDIDRLKRDIEEFFVIHRPMHDCVVDCGDGESILCGISRRTGFPSRFYRNAQGAFGRSEPLFRDDEWDLPIIRKFTQVWRNHVDYENVSERAPVFRRGKKAN